jgi:hypothetical protein
MFATKRLSMSRLSAVSEHSVPTPSRFDHVQSRTPVSPVDELALDLPLSADDLMCTTQPNAFSEDLEASNPAASSTIDEEEEGFTNGTCSILQKDFDDVENGAPLPGLSRRTAFITAMQEKLFGPGKAVGAVVQPTPRLALDDVTEDSNTGIRRAIGMKGRQIPSK